MEILYVILKPYLNKLTIVGRNLIIFFYKTLRNTLHEKVISLFICKLHSIDLLKKHFWLVKEKK